MNDVSGYRLPLLLLIQKATQMCQIVRIVETFEGENFRGLLQTLEISESFLPRKFPAIRYLVQYITIGACMQKCLVHKAEPGQ